MDKHSNKVPSWRQNELIPRCQRKQRGIFKMKSPVISNSKENPSWRQKEVILRFQWEIFNENSIWRQKGINYKVPMGELCANKV